MGFPQFEAGMGGAVLVAPCGMCKTICTADPDTCPSVLIDPQTGRPADVTEAGELIPLDQVAPEAMARSRREPLCPRCIKRVNDAYRATGQAAPFADPPLEDLL
jgi:hypothetical protein